MIWPSPWNWPVPRFCAVYPWQLTPLVGPNLGLSGYPRYLLPCRDDLNAKLMVLCRFSVKVRLGADLVRHTFVALLGLRKRLRIRRQII